MTKKKIFYQLKADIGTLQPKTAALFAAAGLSLPEGQPKKAKKKAWIPAVALTCTAAIAVAVCVPVYLHMQDNHGIVGGVTSSAPEEKKEIVWSMGGGTNTTGAIETGPIDKELQKAMDDPANEGKLFCVRMLIPHLLNEDFVYNGRTIKEMNKQIDELAEIISNGNNSKEKIEAAQQASDQLVKEREKAYQADMQAGEQEKLSKVNPDIKLSLMTDNSDFHVYRDYYAELTKEQIEEIATLGFRRIHLTIPARVEGYDRRIADSLVAMLEYEPQETYFVRVNSVLCKQTKYGNENYNADLIRELKDEEITQEFGDNFLAAIRERHGIEDKYAPINDWGEWEIDSYTLWTGETEKVYFGGFFEAKLTKEEILALAEDPDVRSIYPAISEYEYNKAAPC